MHVKTVVQSDFIFLLILFLLSRQEASAMLRPSAISHLNNTVELHAIQLKSKISGLRIRWTYVKLISYLKNFLIGSTALSLRPLITCILRLYPTVIW